MNKEKRFLQLGLGLYSGTILFDRFILALPDWLAIVLGLLAVVCFVLSITRREYKGTK